MAPARILVVDDNAAFRSVVSEMLPGRGDEVASADNGEHGLNVFLKNNFAIVLSDDEMTGMDGVALACRIKQYSPGVAHNALQHYGERPQRLIEEGEACGDLGAGLDMAAPAAGFIGIIQGQGMPSLLAGDLGRIRRDAPRVFAKYGRGIRCAQ